MPCGVPVHFGFPVHRRRLDLLGPRDHLLEARPIASRAGRPLPHRRLALPGLRLPAVRLDERGRQRQGRPGACRQVGGLLGRRRVLERLDADAVAQILRQARRVLHAGDPATTRMAVFRRAAIAPVAPVDRVEPRALRGLAWTRRSALLPPDPVGPPAFDRLVRRHPHGEAKNASPRLPERSAECRSPMVSVTPALGGPCTSLAPCRPRQALRPTRLLLTAGALESGGR
mmetsp:Transcript_77085/g.223005  ORF Transcript_77085/g.223005 Transcript_77085/m.223005 type:complete len:229 (+) Transcript_77085:946-1632(+)